MTQNKSDDTDTLDYSSKRATGNVILIYRLQHKGYDMNIIIVLSCEVEHEHMNSRNNNFELIC